MAYENELKRLERKRLIAQSLLGAQQPQGQMVGRFFVPPSPLQNVSSLASQLFGAKMFKDTEKKEEELSESRRQALVDALTRSQELMTERPNTAPELLRRSETLPANPMGAVTHLLGTDHPVAQEVGATLFAQQLKPKPGFTLSAGQVRYDASGQPIATGPDSEEWSPPFEYQGALVQKNKKTGQLKSVLGRPSDSTGRGEYIVPIQTAKGVVGFDTRRGRIVDPTSGQPIRGEPVIGSSSDPNLRSRLKMSEGAAKQYNEIVENALRISDQVDIASDTIGQLLNYGGAALGGTGPFSTAGGMKRYFSAPLQELEARFNIINLKNLVTTFQGFSRSIDTAVERAAWNRTQPSITLDDSANLQILIGNVALGTKAQAEAEARRQYIEQSPGKNLEGYRSPIIGKTEVLFNEEGAAHMVSKEEAPSLQSQGWMDADEYAQFLMGGIAQTQGWSIRPLP